MRWQVIEGDCLAVLPTLEAGSVDAIVTDPPYCSGAFSEAARGAAIGQGLRSETLRRDGWFIADNMGTAGIAFLLRSVGFHATRLLKTSGSMLVFCDWRMVSNLAPAIESAGLRMQNLIVWDKGAAGLGCGFRSQHEIILHFTNGSPKYHDAATGNVVKAGRIRPDEREHQTQKPVSLLRKLLAVVTPPDGVVVDPFAGSGSTGVACLDAGFRFIGIERDAGYCEIARRRIATATPPLFAEADQ